MAVMLVALEFDAHDPERLAEFWASMLGRAQDASGTRLPGLSETDFELRFLHSDVPKNGLHRMHVDLTSSSDDDQRLSVERALDLGGSHLDVGQRGDEDHVVLADPEGNEFCVIAAGNRFLADTARIGGIAGEGMPEAGYFWARVLDWPLVWDQDEETAIQSPRGGTKITWGGPPVPPKRGRNRLRWVLAADGDLDTEAGRLRDLGATVLVVGAERVECADPEGNELVVERATTR